MKNRSHAKMKDLPPFSRPREKLLASGAEALSDAELLAVLLGSGIRGKDVFGVAASLVALFDEGEPPSRDRLTAVPGIGAAKAGQILAAFELTRRRLGRRSPAVRKAVDALPFLARIADRKQEHFLCLSLNGANEVIGNRIVTVGLVNATQVHPREVFADAILDRAASVLLAHNHPSGALTPSSDDLAVTRRLRESGELLGIPVLDHLIVSGKGYFSFQEAGLL
ncbi:MAG: DNA repair protein RadC [Desulfobacteraceae bacterium]|nr:DNA repair protein RadC [Desulfobacteraceae bacterium]